MNGRVSPLFSILALAAAGSLPGCLGLEGSTTRPPSPQASDVVLDSARTAGAAWLSFPHGAHGNLTVVARQVTAFPFAIEATWVADGLHPVFNAYEMNFRHQELVLAAGAGGVREQRPPLVPVVQPFDLSVNLTLDHGGPGRLALAWGALPLGIEVHAGSLRERPASVDEAEAMFLDLVTNGTAFAYTPAVQGVQHVGSGGDPALLNLRLILPNNAGQGTLEVRTPGWDWQRAIGPPPVDTTCGDCHSFERHIALVPDGLEAPWSTGFQQVPDCLQSQNGC